MSQQSIVGQGTFIRGNISGSGSLEIQGRIEGNVSMSGDVFVQPGALVKGNVNANQLSVAGAVAGNLTANEGLALEPGARVIGDLVGASIAIADGALVRGLVRTADEAPLASAKQHAAPAVKAPTPAQRPAMGGFGRPASAAHSPAAQVSAHGSSPLAAVKPAMLAPFPRATATTPKPVHVPAPAPAPAPVAAPPPPPPSPASVLPIEPESDVLESVNEDQTPYESDDAEFIASNDTAELGSAEKAAEADDERHDGPPPPVAPALKKGQKAKKKGR